jgi:hypothetical protein
VHPIVDQGHPIEEEPSIRTARRDRTQVARFGVPRRVERGVIEAWYRDAFGVSETSAFVLSQRLHLESHRNGGNLRHNVVLALHGHGVRTLRT